MTPEQETKPEEYNIEVHVEIPDEDGSHKKKSKIIPTWAWLLWLAVSVALMLIDGESELCAKVNTTGFIAGLVSCWFLMARLLMNGL